MFFLNLLLHFVGEKTNLKRSLDESKQKIAHLEEARNVQQKEGEDLRANLRELEKARQEARREIQQLNNQVSFLMFKIPSRSVAGDF